jgi:hypothetical protein
MSKAIQQAAEADRDTFKSVLREVMTTEPDSSNVATNGSAEPAEKTGSEEKPADESTAEKRSLFGGGRGKPKKSSAAANQSESAPEGGAASGDGPTPEPSPS